jgi:xylan 1,4-beta-xylosidase
MDFSPPSDTPNIELTNMRRLLYLSILFVLLMQSTSMKGQQVTSIDVDLKKEVGEMRPVWAWFGYDEPNYTYMKDGKKLLSEIAALSPVPVYVRAHNLLTSGDGTAALKWGSTNIYTEDNDGNPVYNWEIVDKIFDTYVERGMKPLAQFGFMPEAMSTRPDPYQHTWTPGTPYSKIFTGWTSPPKDYNKWSELVYQWVKHCVERYGKKEVDTWYWELWNEPNSSYWGGTVEEYCKLYDYTVSGAVKALPSVKIGGPHTTGPSGTRAAEFLHTFIRHCINGTNYVTGEKGTQLDFVAFHAKGAPRIVEGVVRMNMGQQLRDISRGFEIVASYPELSSVPVIIGESDPEGCAACGMKTNPENAYRNGTLYSSYTAASFARKYQLADHFKVNFTGAVSWSFEFEDQPWFFGFRDLATNGVDKPVLNVFRMFGMMKGKRVGVISTSAYQLMTIRDSSVRKGPDISAIAAYDKKTVTVMLWNYHDDDKFYSPAEVSLQLQGIPSKQVKVTHYRIDHEHSNSYEVWKKMGSPQQPTPAQITQLEKAGKLEMLNAPQQHRVDEGVLHLKTALPYQAVSLVKIEL